VRLFFEKVPWLAYALSTFIVLLTIKLAINMVLEERLTYVKGLGVQVQTTTLSGHVHSEFYRVEDIVELKLQEIFSGVGAVVALVLHLKDADPVVLFEVSPFHLIGVSIELDSLQASPAKNL
jgi:hypothetical protein